MTFWGKVLLGLAGVVVSSSIGTTVAYRDSLFGGSSLSDNKTEISESNSSNSQSGCYVVPTETNNNPAKLLVCKGQDTLNSGENVEYLLYNHNGHKSKTKVKEMKKKDNQLEITLKEGSETVALSIKSGDWTEITTELDLKASCNLEVYPENNGGTKWKCSNGLGVAEKEIKLKEFKFKD